MMSPTKAKTHLGKALAEVLGITVTLTPAGYLSRQTCRDLNSRGYYWFPGKLAWDKLK